MSKKRTTEEFIKESKKIHGNRYDYSSVNYTNRRSKILITCPEHGSFWQSAGIHLKGSGCPICASVRRGEYLKSDTKSFIEKSNIKHDNKYDYSKVNYINNHTKVCIICPEHGEFWQRPHNHLNGEGCPKCVCNTKLKNFEFIQKAKKIHGSKYIYSKVEYVNSKTKVCIICPEHGEFWQSPSKHLQGNGCSKCSGKAKLTTEDFIKKANKIHKNKYDYSETIYVSAKEKLKIICPIHGEFWTTSTNHFGGKGCPKCASSGVKLTTEEFITKAKRIHKNSYDYSKVQYVNAVTPIHIICPIHGEFSQTPNRHLCGCGCPKCILKSQNKLFEKLKESLQEELIWEYTAKWLGKQRIDIFIPKYNIGVEYNGRQHYDPVKAWGGDEGLKITQQRDSLKLEKCNNHGVKLLYLKYDYSEQDFENLVQDIHKIIENNT